MFGAAVVAFAAVKESPRLAGATARRALASNDGREIGAGTRGAPVLLLPCKPPLSGRSRKAEPTPMCRPPRSHLEVAIDSPYQGFGRVSRDGSVAYATVTFDKQAGDLPAKAAQPLIDAVKTVKEPGLRIELSGPVVARGSSCENLRETPSHAIRRPTRT